MKANARMSPTISPAARPAFEKKLLPLLDALCVLDGAAVGVLTIVVPPMVTVTLGVAVAVVLLDVVLVVRVVLSCVVEEDVAVVVCTHRVSKPKGAAISRCPETKTEERFREKEKKRHSSKHVNRCRMGEAVR